MKVVHNLKGGNFVCVFEGMKVGRSVSMSDFHIFGAVVGSFIVALTAPIFAVPIHF